MKAVNSPYEIAGNLSALVGAVTFATITVMSRGNWSDFLSVALLACGFLLAGLGMLLYVRNCRGRLDKLRSTGLCYVARVLEVRDGFAGFKISGIRTFFLLCEYVDEAGKTREVSSGLLSVRKSHDLFAASSGRGVNNILKVKVHVNRANADDYAVGAYLMGN